MSHIYNGPALATDIIILRPEGIVLIERKNPPRGFALPGGFAEKGITLEENASKEAKEETGLELKNIKLFTTRSDPLRDPRDYVVSVVFIADGVGEIKAGDDAEKAKVYSFAEIGKLIHSKKLAFDHDSILLEYMARRVEKFKT